MALWAVLISATIPRPWPARQGRRSRTGAPAAIMPAHRPHAITGPAVPDRDGEADDGHVISRRWLPASLTIPLAQVIVASGRRGGTADPKDTGPRYLVSPAQSGDGRYRRTLDWYLPCQGPRQETGPAERRGATPCPRPPPNSSSAERRGLCRSRVGGRHCLLTSGC